MRRLHGLSALLSVLALSGGLVACGEDAPTEGSPGVDAGGDGGETELPPRADLVSAVNPMIGTGGVGFGVGSAYPGPALPFAMIHAGPDTNTAGFDGLGFYHCAGYHYGDPFIEAFSLTHAYGTGVSDYGTFGLMPLVLSSGAALSADVRSEAGYASGYSGEVAQLGYYSVDLEGGRKVEITSTRRAALFRFSFPEAGDPVVLLDAEHTVGDGKSGGGDVQLSGSNITARMHNLGDLSGRFGGFEIFMDGVFDVAPSEVGVWDEAGMHPAEATASGIDVGGWVRFPAGTREVSLRVAVSFVDAEGASKNLQAELPDFDFDAVRARAVAAWGPIFDELEVYTADATDTQTVATSVYHTFMMPSLMSDVDGRARGVATETEPLGPVIQPPEEHYSDFSLWDTYRTFHPWFMLAERPEAGLFARSLVRLGEQGGAIPRWALANGDVHSMIGSPGEIVLAESALKGVEFDQARAYALSRVSAVGKQPGTMGGRGSIEPYMQYGYVPSDMSSGSVSRTQEYATADAALGNWAERMGETEDAATFSARGDSWRALYDADSGFFRGKTSDGSWAPMSLPTVQADMYTEGNAWQYLWMIGHDPAGLAEQLGGEEAARARLQEFFDSSREETAVLGVRNYYWHGNEPNILAPWLFAAWGDRTSTRDFVHWVIDEMYGTGPDGLAGNDDAGTLSSWLLFASVGLYPVSGTDRYVVGAPRFQKVVLHRPQGDLTVEASRDPRQGQITGVTLDGAPIEGPFVTHAALQGAHVLRFEIAE
ncbi:MAG: GH92 family glycosyl hydrolase [Polyangiaceae bacterium]